MDYTTIMAVNVYWFAGLGFTQGPWFEIEDAVEFASESGLSGKIVSAYYREPSDAEDVLSIDASSYKSFLDALMSAVAILESEEATATEAAAVRWIKDYVEANDDDISELLTDVEWGEKG